MGKGAWRSRLANTFLTLDDMELKLSNILQTWTALFLLGLLALPMIGALRGMAAPNLATAHLRCEYLKNPPGIEATHDLAGVLIKPKYW